MRERKCVVVEETCQFRPGDEQGDPDGEQREQGEPFLTEAQQKRAHEEYRGDERDVPIGQDHVAVQQRLEKFPASRRQLGETGHLSRIGIPKEGVSCEKNDRITYGTMTLSSFFCSMSVSRISFEPKNETNNLK